MTTVDILARQLEQSGVDAAKYRWRDYTLHVVAGRRGSVCFTLLQEIPPAVWIVQAEGFTLDGAIHYTQHVLGDVEVQHIIREVIDARRSADLARALPVEEASGCSADLAAHA